MAATAIGGTLLLLQIAHHKGYIKVHIFFCKTVPRSSHWAFSLCGIWMMIYRWTGVRWLRTRLQWPTRLRRSCTSSPSLAWRSFRSLSLFTNIGMTWPSTHVLFRNGVPKTSTLLVDSLGGFSSALHPPNPVGKNVVHCWSEWLGRSSLLKSGYAAFSYWPSQPPQRLYE